MDGGGLRDRGVGMKGKKEDGKVTGEVFEMGNGARGRAPGYMDSRRG